MAAIQFTQAGKTDATNQSCTFQQGAAFYFDFKPLDGSGNPLDTTNYTFDGSFKSAFDSEDKSHYDGRPVLSFNATAGNVINDTTNSRFIVLFLASATEAIKFKGDTLDGVYDFYLSAPDGTRVRALWGDWTLTREVTAQ
jgi:hypothetical protein